VGSPAKADFMLKKVSPKIESVPIIVEIPNVTQPSQPIETHIPQVVIIQPEIIPSIPKSALPEEPEPIPTSIEPVTIVQPTQPVVAPIMTEEKIVPQPVLILTDVIVTQPTQPPEIWVRFDMDRIPPGDPNIFVTSNIPLKRVIVTHPDGNTFELALKGNEWTSHFFVPYDVPDGPYWLLVSATDATDRTWQTVGLIIIDNAIPCIYVDLQPNDVTVGQTAKIRVTLLNIPKSVTAMMDDGTVIKLHKAKDIYHWTGIYTIPANAKKGIHKFKVNAVAEDEKHEFAESAIYRVR